MIFIIIELILLKYLILKDIYFALIVIILNLFILMLNQKIFKNIIWKNNLKFRLAKSHHNN